MKYQVRHLSWLGTDVSETASLQRSPMPGHPRLGKATQTWMPGIKPDMTKKLKSSYHGVIEIVEKSTNQLFGCTKFLIFGLMARGATSWAT